MALGLDHLQRIINVHWGGEFQGLLAEWPIPETSESFGPPTAYALESGQSFSGVNMGATGLGFTVLTPGLVCFGKPRDGDACFIASPDFTYIGDGPFSLKRGALGESGGIKWKSTGSSGSLIALTFAGDAFFAVYLDEDAITTRIDTSYDGLTWSSSTAFAAPGGANCIGGAVAYNGKSFVSVGAREIDIEDEFVFQGSTTGLAWETSGDGSGWSYGDISGEMQDPGAWMSSIRNQACSVAGGKGVFVAAAMSKTRIFRGLVGDDAIYSIDPTAAAAVSSSGADWTTTILSGATVAGDDGDSNAKAVVFIRAKSADPEEKDGGYFLCTAVNSSGISTLHRSENGTSWSDPLRTSQGRQYYWTLSAIAKTLSDSTIIHI